MALEPITRQEKIIAGQDLTPITRMEMFLKNFGGGGGSVPAAGGVTTLHINVTAVNQETMEATFTADKTPTEMQAAAATGPTWCVVSFAAGLMGQEAVSVGAPPAWSAGIPAFGDAFMLYHDDQGYNIHTYAVLADYPNSWILNLEIFGG